MCTEERRNKDESKTGKLLMMGHPREGVSFAQLLSRTKKKGRRLEKGLRRDSLGLEAEQRFIVVRRLVKDLKLAATGRGPILIQVEDGSQPATVAVVTIAAVALIVHVPEDRTAICLRTARE